MEKPNSVRETYNRDRDRNKKGARRKWRIKA